MPERPDNDERFTFGLTYDVAKVLSDHGYPMTTAGAEFVTLQQALFQVLYNDTELGTRALQTVDAYEPDGRRVSRLLKLQPMVEQFQAIGRPNYSDVVDRGFCWPTYDEAKNDGENFLRCGNWSSFQITKHFTLGPQGVDSESSAPSHSAESRDGA